MGFRKNSIEIELNKLHSERVAIAFNFIRGRKNYLLRRTMVRWWRTGGSAEGKDQTTFYFTSLYSLSLERLSFSLLVLVSVANGVPFMYTHSVLHVEISVLWIVCEWENGWSIRCRCRRAFFLCVHNFYVRRSKCMCEIPKKKIRIQLCCHHDHRQAMQHFDCVQHTQIDRLFESPRTHEPNKNQRKTLPLERKGKIFISFGEDSLSQLHFSLANIRYIDFDE